MVPRLGADVGNTQVDFGEKWIFLIIPHIRYNTKRMKAESTIQELLERGLYHYGLGEVQKALELWREVLRREPDNETAREYIEIETGRPVSAEVEPEEAIPQAEVVEDSEIKSAGGLRPEFMEGQRYLQRGEIEKASLAFESAHRQDSDNLLYWAHVELSRAKLIKDVRERLGDPASAPALKVPLTQLIGQKNFTQEEGFVLSLISGETDLDDIVALSPLPRFHTYRILHLLLQEDLVVTERKPG